MGLAVGGAVTTDALIAQSYWAGFAFGVIIGPIACTCVYLAWTCFGWKVLIERISTWSQK